MNDDGLEDLVMAAGDAVVVAINDPVDGFVLAPKLPTPTGLTSVATEATAHEVVAISSPERSRPNWRYLPI